MGESWKWQQTILGYAACMTLPRLDELLPTLAHPQVRDLAWTLLSPPILSEAPAPQRHPLTASRWATHPDAMSDWLRALDRQPDLLLAWLAQHSIRRLGLYYERLWQFAVSQAPDVDLLVANLPIRNGGQTLGELDLIVRDDEGVHHIELAVKFYLGTDEGDRHRHDRWLGPGSHDRLDIKLQRLCAHQLQLCGSAEARSLLCELTSRDIRSALWMGGYLFQPMGVTEALPDGANPDHLRGHWTRYRDWIAGDEFAQGRWHPLARPAWLAPARLEHAPLSLADDWQRWHEAFLRRGQARLLVRLNAQPEGHWAECERRFIVPDAWPGQAAEDA